MEHIECFILVENQVQVVSTAEVGSHVSPTNKGDCNPFWNSMTMEISGFCGCQGSVSKSVKTLMSNSWFSVSLFDQISNLLMNSSLSPSSMGIGQQKIAAPQKEKEEGK
jgi:hypothetical protein